MNEKFNKNKTEENMVSKNLNYYYNVEYYNNIDFENIDSTDNQEKLKTNNDNLKNFEAKKDDFMPKDFGDYSIDTFELQTVYPGLLIGTGNPHSFGGKGEIKLGFSFDYVTGMPYIPSSSVKGMIRSAFIHQDYIKSLLGDGFADLDVEKLKKAIFGESRSQYEDKNDIPKSDTFFDAVLTSDKNTKILDLDYITPHRQNKELMELVAPNPITMVKVRPNINFAFRFKLYESHIDNKIITIEQKKNLFKTILIDLGIGAKTNVGYGVLIDPPIQPDPNICPQCLGKKNPNYPLCSVCSAKNQKINTTQQTNNNFKKKIKK